MSWILRNQNQNISTESYGSVEWPLLIKKILSSRNISPDQAMDQYIKPTLKLLKDPLVLDQMDRAVERLIKAKTKNEKIAVYADFDLDGTSGLALLVEGLAELGFDQVIHYQPSRLSEGYGLHVAAIDALAEQNVRVVVTVDVGITAHEAVNAAQAKGMDVIITDHHLPKDTLPSAFAIVNPNKGSCASGLGHLSGAGVAFYLVLALKRELEKTQPTPFNPKSLLDYFVIGTLTDMVPLVEENRVLVKHGLIQLQNTLRPGLRQLLNRLNLSGRPLTSSDVAAVMAPKLNALSRLDGELKPRHVLILKSEDEAQALIDKVLETNELRRYLQKEAEALAFEKSKSQANQSVIFVWDESFHKGVIGLIATALCEEYGRPCLVGHLDENGTIHGSGRAPNGYHLPQIFESFGDGVLNALGGMHRPLALRFQRRKLITYSS